MPHLESQPHNDAPGRLPSTHFDPGTEWLALRIVFSGVRVLIKHRVGLDRKQKKQRNQSSMQAQREFTHRVPNNPTQAQKRCCSRWRGDSPELPLAAGGVLQAFGDLDSGTAGFLMLPQKIQLLTH